MHTLSLPMMNRRRYFSALAWFTVFFLATLAIAPLIGATRINLTKALSSEIDFANNVDAHILFLARLPRILLAAITGASLSVAGAVFQAILRNDLAAPITLGVSSGAAFGAVLAISLGFSFTVWGFSSRVSGSHAGGHSCIQSGENPAGRIAHIHCSSGGCDRQFLFRGAGHVHPLSFRRDAILPHCSLADGWVGYHRLPDGFFDLPSGFYRKRHFDVYRERSKLNQLRVAIRNEPRG
jgi:hypothetical protein